MLIDEADQPSGWALPRLPGRRAIVFGVVTVLGLGAALSTMIWRDLDQKAEREEASIEQRVGDRLAAEVRVLGSGVAGASNILDEQGRPVRARFERLAGELAGSTVIERMSWSPAERGAAGELHAPIEWVHPATPELLRLVGYDLATDPQRAATVAAAAVGDGPVFSPPMASLSTGEAAFVVYVPVRTPSGELVGLLSGAASGSELFSLASSFVPRGTPVSITDAGRALFGAAQDGGTAVEVEAGGRRWRVDARPPAPRHDAAIVTMILATLLAASVGWSLVRQRRQAQELDAAARSVRMLGRLSERLASSHTLRELVSIATVAAAPPVSADAALVVFRPSFHGEPWLPGCVDGAGAHDVELLIRAAELSLGGAEVMVRRRARTKARPAIRRAMARPLTGVDDEVIGAIAWGWQSRRAQPPRARSTTEAMRVLWEDHAVRVRAEVTALHRAAALTRLGQALSVARDVADIADAAVRHGAAASGCDAVALGTLVDHGSAVRMVFGPEPDAGASEVLELPTVPGAPLLQLLRAGEELVFGTPEALLAVPALQVLHGRARAARVLPLIDSTGELVGVVAFVTGVASPAGDTTNIRAIADLLGQTMERAALFEAQRELVAKVQQRSLPAIPQLDGVDVAARYAPAAHRVGVGGDWYDVGIDASGRCVMVVGDVAGHGIDAVVDMVEVSAIVAALARGGGSVGDVAARAYRLLEPAPGEPMRMATVVVARVDPAVGLVEYVLLGHPPPLLRHIDGTVEVLQSPVWPPIGCSSGAPEACERKLEAGESLLLYTDGLLERHGRSFDAGLERLGAVLGAAGAEPHVDVALGRVMADMGVADEAMDDVSALLLRFG